MTHTPRPWKVKKFSNAAPVIVGEGWMGARRIAKVLYEGGSEDPEVHANAVLIAAAPDMLEALKAIIAACDEPTPHLPKIKHIAKNAIVKG